MANSQYYGRKDPAFVKDAQTKLNAQGAGISVDGSWGPKTESAYSKYGSKVQLAKPTTPTAATTGGATPKYNALTGTIDLPAGMDPNDPLLGLKNVFSNNAEDLKTQYQGERQAIQNAALAKGMSSSSIPITQIADSKSRESTAVERQGNQMAVDAVTTLQSLKRDEDARAFQREQFDWQKYMDNQNFNLAKSAAARSGSGGSKVSKDPFALATPAQISGYNKANSNLIVNAKYDPKVIYTNLLTNPSKMYTDLGPLYNVLLSDAKGAYENSTKKEEPEPVPSTLGPLVTDYQRSDDKESWLNENRPYMTDAEVKWFEGWLQDN